MITATQFAFQSYLRYISHHGEREGLPGTCRLCGGDLFLVNEYPIGTPIHYEDKTDKIAKSPIADWLREELIKDRSSKYVCPACRWQAVAFSNGSLVVAFDKIKMAFASGYLFTSETMKPLTNDEVTQVILEGAEPPFVFMCKKATGNRPYYYILAMAQVAYSKDLFPVTVAQSLYGTPCMETLYVDKRKVAIDKEPQEQFSQVDKIRKIFF